MPILLDNAVTIALDVPDPDLTRPEVTINQGTTQLDPVTTLDPIVFDVVFTEPVTGFDSPADVVLSGTAGATTAAITPVSTTNYTVTVTGMTMSGTVIASIPADAATDTSLAANESNAHDHCQRNDRPRRWGRGRGWRWGRGRRRRRRRRKRHRYQHRHGHTNDGHHRAPGNGCRPNVAHHARRGSTDRGVRPDPHRAPGTDHGLIRPKWHSLSHQ